MIRELVLCPRCGADTLVRQDESGNIMEDIPHAPLSYKEQLWPKGHFVRMNEPPDSAKEIRYPVRCTNVLSNKIVYAPQESDGEEYAFARMSVPCDWSGTLTAREVERLLPQIIKRTGNPRV